MLQNYDFQKVFNIFVIIFMKKFWISTYFSHLLLAPKFSEVFLHPETGVYRLIYFLDLYPKIKMVICVFFLRFNFVAFIFSVVLKFANSSSVAKGTLAPPELYPFLVIFDRSSGVEEANENVTCAAARYDWNYIITTAHCATFSLNGTTSRFTVTNSTMEASSVASNKLSLMRS